MKSYGKLQYGPQCEYVELKFENLLTIITNFASIIVLNNCPTLKRFSIVSESYEFIACISYIQLCRVNPFPFNGNVIL